MAVNPNTDFVAGAILTASQQNRFPRGVMGYVERTAGSTGPVTTEVDVTGVTVTFTGQTGRLYRVSTGVTGLRSTNAGYIFANIKDASNALLNQVIGSGSAGDYMDLSTNFVMTANGSTTIRMTAGADGNGGTILGVSTTRCTMIVEDLGPY